jgi:hypothetical protein
MDAMQLTAAHPHGDRVAVDTAGRELPRGDDRVLAGGELGDRDIRPRCDVRGLRPGNLQHERIVPPRPSQDHTRVQQHCAKRTFTRPLRN